MWETVPGAPGDETGRIQTPATTAEAGRLEMALVAFAGASSVIVGQRW
jgi:hypothetical protein